MFNFTVLLYIVNYSIIIVIAGDGVKPALLSPFLSRLSPEEFSLSNYWTDFDETGRVEKSIEIHDNSRFKNIDFCTSNKAVTS